MLGVCQSVKEEFLTQYGDNVRQSLDNNKLSVLMLISKTL